MPKRTPPTPYELGRALQALAERMANPLAPAPPLVPYDTAVRSLAREFRTTHPKMKEWLTAACSTYEVSIFKTKAHGRILWKLRVGPAESGEGLISSWESATLHHGALDHEGYLHPDPPQFVDPALDDSTWVGSRAMADALLDQMNAFRAQSAEERAAADGRLEMLHGEALSHIRGLCRVVTGDYVLRVQALPGADPAVPRVALQICVWDGQIDELGQALKRLGVPPKTADEAP